MPAGPSFTKPQRAAARLTSATTMHGVKPATKATRRRLETPELAAIAEAVNYVISWQFEEEHWRAGCQCVAGVDEAGRGPLAGNVVASAVILPRDYAHAHLNDSKQVNAARRAEVAAHLRARSDVVWAIGEASVEEIDTINILHASMLAMRRALAALSLAPDAILVDGNRAPGGDGQAVQRAIVAGDARSFSIAAASILAKEWRDAQMREFCAVYPVYGFSQHKGYATQQHRTALAEHGPCPLHRRTFLASFTRADGAGPENDALL